jgi:multidrug efflux system membrane fusion protein
MIIRRPVPARRAPSRWVLGRQALCLLAGSVALFALGPLAGCSKDAAKQGRPAMGPVPVTAGQAVVKDVPVILKAIGTVEAVNTVNVRPRVGGEVIRVEFREGDSVRKGEMLIAIDPRPYEIALQAALADSARNSALSAGADAQRQRYAELVDKDYVTKDQFDQVKSAAAALHAALDADAAACRSARLNLSFCSIRAPISGRTGNLLVHPGNLVSANDANPLVVIQQIVPAYVAFSVPEPFLPEIRERARAGSLRVEVMASGDSSQAVAGDLTFIDNGVDESTGMIRLKATFPNPDESLWPGQFMDVSLFLSVQKDAVVVPARAVQKSQQGSFVYVIQPDLTVAMRPVTVGTETGGEVVVDRGVQAGDRVVTDGQLRLVPGAKVDVRGGAAPAESTAS